MEEKCKRWISLKNDDLDDEKIKLTNGKKILLKYKKKITSLIILLISDVRTAL